jgi:hypothetical protein
LENKKNEENEKGGGNKNFEPTSEPRSTSQRNATPTLTQSTALLDVRREEKMEKGRGKVR